MKKAEQNTSRAYFAIAAATRRRRIWVEDACLVETGVVETGGLALLWVESDKGDSFYGTKARGQATGASGAHCLSWIVKKN